MTRDELEQLARDIGVTRIRVSSTNIIGCCPLHSEDNPSFGISITKPGHLWNCYSLCGGGTLPNLLVRLYNLTYADALKELAKYGVYEIPDEALTHREKDFYTPNLSSAMVPFLHNAKSRPPYHKLRRETCTRAGIGYDKFSKRYVIPWRVNGEIIGITSHSSQKGLKMLPMFEFNPKAALYFPPNSEIDDSLIIVEGIADALRLYEYGYRNVCAINAATISANQRKLIARMGISEIHALLDPDPAGAVGAVRMARKMPYVLVHQARLAGKDPADSGRYAISRALKDAKVILP